VRTPCHHFPAGLALIPVNAARDATAYPPVIRAATQPAGKPMSDPAPPEERQHAMADALRAWDPEAEVAVEAGTGRLMVLTTLPADRVAAILEEAGTRVACGASR
jgi:xanthine dehydrogenase iron-sulfur cluster and FAD-binding subunit A